MTAALSTGALVAIGATVAVGAGATVYAADKAAGATQSSTNAAINEQQAALTQQQQLNQPYNKIGLDATSQYEGLLGIGPNANAQTISQALKNTPGYQFTQQQGETGILNAASAAGGVSGNTLTALDQYNTGLADQTYQNALSNSQGAVGLGQAAAAGQAANIGNAAGNVSNMLVGQGQNQANIDIGTAAGISRALGSGANNYAEYSALQALSSTGSNNPFLTSGAGGTIDQNGYIVNLPGQP